VTHRSGSTPEWTARLAVKTRQPVNWYILPVINTRFPEFAAALGWGRPALANSSPRSASSPTEHPSESGRTHSWDN
jgi:hypothetical protein